MSGYRTTRGAVCAATEQRGWPYARRRLDQTQEVDDALDLVIEAALSWAGTLTPEKAAEVASAVTLLVPYADM